MTCFWSASSPWYLFLSDDDFSDNGEEYDDEEDDTAYDDLNPLNHGDDVG